MSVVEGLDEMVDGQGSIRPHWRSILGTLTALGDGGIAQRARRLDRMFEQEGVSSLIPGTVEREGWRCDPVPLPITAREFSTLAWGLAQRATLLSAILQDVYGPQRVLSEGWLPPALVYGNRAFLRACRSQPDYPPGRQNGTPPGKMLDFYSADLIRAPDGRWHVLADRTCGCAGLGYALENRRILARVMPESFRVAHVRRLRPFFDFWLDRLQEIAPRSEDGQSQSNPMIVLLTPGYRSPQWFEHMFLSRELSCALVEGGDLTVRNGRVFLKTLRGLQPVDVVLRRTEGVAVDPLELAPGPGTVGLLEAARSGSVTITNSPGTDMAEAPGLAAFIPLLAEKMLGEGLHIPQVPSLWLGGETAWAEVRQDLSRWVLRSAMDSSEPPIIAGALSEDERAALEKTIAANPGRWSAFAHMVPSRAPCAGPDGLTPRPITLRIFLAWDGNSWRAMQGGLAYVVQEGQAGGARLASHGMSKDVWVLADDHQDLAGPALRVVTRLAPRRTAAAVPSRVADNLYWLGRYVERLDSDARLARAALTRLNRGLLLPHEMVELDTLGQCLATSGLLSSPVGAGAHGLLASGLLSATREDGALGVLLGRVARLTELVRDRLTDEMYATFTTTLRSARAETLVTGKSLDQMAQAMAEISRFCTAVSGAAAENMVRGGGWMFLELGRRIERAWTSAGMLATVLDTRPSWLETSLRVALELCDSAITYRNRYLTAIQPDPALDLVIADPDNPRSLIFQLVAIRERLMQVAEAAQQPDEAVGLIAAANALGEEAVIIAGDVVKADDPYAATLTAAKRLRGLETGAAALSDQITRQYFTLLPSQSVGQPRLAEEDGVVS
ncbi:Hypothetical protein GbCGDNIH9_0518 [Granulibacter bethesdensis]|uniref:DUF403 domain-containing protein n=1 Tax=Granulibacter bethesdensis TaxID=364410 RepID=A0AAC9K926_9PROT|nr:circularly permuted type 2 ATP-grasp protein [Granulibacter bethesdensis]APH53759.1 Hypothetical protein GbCGDNIH9_0518 [Granulibacter bethesdensis]APH61338.1 Hypothetical protein GbCGDNIH8_0518 [Granulibacter bethesdensis]